MADKSATDEIVEKDDGRCPVFQALRCVYDHRQWWDESEGKCDHPALQTKQAHEDDQDI